MQLKTKRLTINHLCLDDVVDLHRKKNVVVIGSGTMGSGIAAHLCNANIPVTLLDLKTEISENARERIHKSRPPLLIDKSKINNIEVGNISDDFSVVEKADWIVEAVVERIDIKHKRLTCKRLRIYSLA